MSEKIAEVFKYMSQGVYVISVKNEEQTNAFTAAWVMPVSFNPPLICFSINPNNHSYSMLKENPVCCISVLEKSQVVAAEHFGSSNTQDKMKAYTWLKTKSGLPTLSNSLAYFNCEVDHYSDAGDHQLVICNVTHAVILNKGVPMIYSDTGNMDGSETLYKEKTE